jgi:predicted RNA-binding protein
MCEASAYLKDGEDNRLVMESVDRIEPDDHGISLVNIFGEQKFLKARIHSLALVEHRIYLTPME